MQRFSSEQRILLTLTALSFADDGDRVSFDGVDFQRLREEASVQTVSLEIFERVAAYKAQFLPEEYQVWRKQASRISQNNFMLVEGQRTLVEVLEEAEIPYVVMKGAAAAAYYKEPSLRMLGDVDFLVRVEDLARGEEVLLKNGYVKEGDDDHDCHLLFRKGGVRYEMHFEPSGIPYGSVGEEIREYLKGVTARRQTLCQEGNAFFAPSPCDHGLILLLHMQHHMLGEGLGVRHLCDWGHFVSSTENSPFWTEELLPLLKRVGLYRYAQVMTKTCHLYLRARCPEWAKAAEDEVCKEVMADILQGGNFGQKDDLRAKSGMLISKNGKNGTKDGAGKNLCKTLHRSVMKKYPVVKKFPPLYPFLFLWRMVRYGTLMLFGKRDSIVKMLPEAEKRKAVYQKLHVFEIDKKE